MRVHLQLRYHDSSKHTHTNYKNVTELCWDYPQGNPQRNLYSTGDRSEERAGRSTVSRLPIHRCKKKFKLRLRLCLSLEILL